ncbi:MAG: hypothetical protein U9N44_07775 [Chloroflexota bacterium]|nr:hypothetical protein [Chloroflexota bacterium]
MVTYMKIMGTAMLIAILAIIGLTAVAYADSPGGNESGQQCQLQLQAQLQLRVEANAQVCQNGSGAQTQAQVGAQQQNRVQAQAQDCTGDCQIKSENRAQLHLRIAECFMETVETRLQLAVENGAIDEAQAARIQERVRDCVQMMTRHILSIHGSAALQGTTIVE